MNRTRYINALLEFPWKLEGLKEEIKAKKALLVGEAVRRRTADILKRCLENAILLECEFRSIRERDDCCYCCGNNENCGVNEYDICLVQFLHDNEVFSLQIISYDYVYNIYDNYDKRVICNGVSVMNPDVPDYRCIKHFHSNSKSQRAGEYRDDRTNNNFLSIKCQRNRDIRFSWIHTRIICQAYPFENDFDNSIMSRKQYLLHELIEVDSSTHRRALEDNRETIYDQYKIETNSDDMCKDPIKIAKVLNKFTVKDLKMMFKAERKIYTNFNTYPILFVQKIVMLIMFSRKDSNSSLSTLPRDVLKIIAEYVWSSRYNIELWIN